MTVALAMAWPWRAELWRNQCSLSEREPRDPQAGPSLAGLTNHHEEPVPNLQVHIRNGWQQARGPQNRKQQRGGS